MNSKVLGSMMMVAGTTIGAGMLVMPVNSAEVGLGVTLLELFFFFLLMILPALVVIELSQFAPRGSTVAGLLRLEFGNGGFIVGNLLFYVFVYSLTCAYISGLSDVFGKMLGVPQNYQSIFTIAVVLVLGLIVIFTSRFADLVNRIFFYLMCVAFVVLVVMSIPNLKVEYLASTPVSSSAVIKSIPIFFLTFGFHIIIPALSDYLDRNTRDLKIAIVGGLAIPFVVFSIWVIMIHGQVSQEELIVFSQSGDVSVADLIAHGHANKFLNITISTFSICALLTSFIGVSLALITTLKETFSRSLPKKSEYVTNHLEEESEEVIYGSTDRIKTFLNRPALFLVAFAIPTFVVLYTPEAFVFFLKLAAVIFTVQNLVLPIIALIRMRVRHKELYAYPKAYRLSLNNIVLGIVALILLVLAFM
ncbi:amino acid permease [Psittacicella hinzii]|uniref:Tyrosine-specific transport protein n=1 Tax=Psittacicella hinzii TaxID=2028575 RepID=A0A3A1YJX7_9GAMM|nr:aromatic amino acid transport family protein [Psittacicella hinzii]RIY37539.1 hypothetical protein CKF58_04835 [Psittacicella hinzii]